MQSASVLWAFKQGPELCEWAPQTGAGSWETSWLKHQSPSVLQSNGCSRLYVNQSEPRTTAGCCWSRPSAPVCSAHRRITVILKKTQNHRFSAEFCRYEQHFLQFHSRWYQCLAAFWWYLCSCSWTSSPPLAQPFAFLGSMTSAGIHNKTRWDDSPVPPGAQDT